MSLDFPAKYLKNLAFLLHEKHFSGAIVRLSDNSSLQTPNPFAAGQIAQQSGNSFLVQTHLADIIMLDDHSKKWDVFKTNLLTCFYFKEER